ncbi:MAG: M48 family metalloprotease [Lysobacteraceae bacterium]
MPVSVRSLLTATVLCALSLQTSAQSLDSAAPKSTLPDIGSSAESVITPGDEVLYGKAVLRQIRYSGELLDDALLTDYLQSMGERIARQGERTEQPYTFFFMKSREINAFATLGGYVGMNAGLFLTATREDEVAAVLAHEISHVTQRHVLRAYERRSKDTLPIMLATLGAILVAQSAGGNSSGEATEAAVASGMALLQQRAIDYTRDNEYEADRVGIQTLAKAGYDPRAMADFFARMARAMRSTIGGDEGPEFLRTHPVTTTRISEAKDRAEKVRVTGFVPPPRATSSNPLLPAHLLDTRTSIHAVDRTWFAWAQARMRVLSARSPTIAIDELQQREQADVAQFGAPDRYALALAKIQIGEYDIALRELTSLREQGAPWWVDLAIAEAQYLGGHRALARDSFEQLSRARPDNRAIALTYASSLIRSGEKDEGQRAQAVLRPLLLTQGDDPDLQSSFARASELAGDPVRAGEAHAEAALLAGGAEDALNQLNALKQRDDLDYYQRARIDARIVEITPWVLELRERGRKASERQQISASALQHSDERLGWRVGTSLTRD